MSRTVLGLVALTGCNTLLGIDDPRIPSDAAAVDGEVDAPVVVDASPDAPPDSPLSVCPTGYDEMLAGHFYRVVQNSVAWSQARGACGAEGTHLVTIGSQAEQDLVASLLTPTTVTVWIGLHRESGSGPFTWVGGEPVTFVGWATGEPDGAMLADCANARSPGWFDNQCADLRAYVCECEPID